MTYENSSREELRIIAKERGVVDFATASKTKLIRILNSLDELIPSHPATKEIIKEIVEEVEKKEIKQKSIPNVESKSTTVLSAQAKNWRAYLEKLKISPEDYLIRYPNHVNKRFIEELLS